MFFLKDHLIEGTFTTAYCDTDSMALATCRTDEELNGSTMEEKLRAVFDPIVKPEMRNHWEANWKKWFVTEDTVEDEKFPGKLKFLRVKYNAMSSRDNFFKPACTRQIAMISERFEGTLRN